MSLDQIKFYIKIISDLVEIIGVLTIFFGILVAFFRFFYAKDEVVKRNYHALRQSLGKAILLGLEILIAADIMATVVIDPSLKSVSVLGLIVLIRTLMSLSLEVEITGKFPWQTKNKKT